MKTIITILFLMLLSFAYSQEKGSVFLSVFPKDAVIKLNDTLLKSHETYPLDTGSYTLKMWAPKREYKERTITISESKINRLHEVLSYSDDYRDFKKTRRMYTVGKGIMRYVTPVVMVWFVQNSFSTWNKLEDKMNIELDLAKTAKINYENGVIQSDIFYHKNNYEGYKESYEKRLADYNESRKNRMIIGSALLVTTVALEYLSFKLKKPEYKEKVLLSSFGLNNYNYKITPSLSLTYKFN